jgi:hypothetical protein
MALNSDDLNTEIQPDLKTKIIERLDHHFPKPAEMSVDSAAAFTSHRDKLALALSEACAEIISEKVVSHIVENLEVKGIKVKLPKDSGVATVTPPQGGALAILEDIIIDQDQGNEGTGRVS